MDYTAIRYAEESLYARKYLYGRMQELLIVIDCIVPASPGSVLKIIGKPMAKTPVDTSETERFGILRATCREAEQLEAKMKLFNILVPFKASLEPKEKEFVKLLYEKEYPAMKVRNSMNLKQHEYYNLRSRILSRLWNKIKVLGQETLDSAVI